MDLLTLPEIAAMLKTSEGIALQIMADTPYLHLGTGNAEARGSIHLISTKKTRQLDQENLAAFFRGLSLWVMANQIIDKNRPQWPTNRPNKIAPPFLTGPLPTSSS